MLTCYVDIWQQQQSAVICRFTISWSRRRLLSTKASFSYSISHWLLFHQANILSSILHHHLRLQSPATNTTQNHRRQLIKQKKNKRVFNLYNCRLSSIIIETDCKHWGKNDLQFIIRFVLFYCVGICFWRSNPFAISPEHNRLIFDQLLFFSWFLCWPLKTCYYLFHCWTR